MTKSMILLIIEVTLTCYTLYCLCAVTNEDTDQRNLVNLEKTSFFRIILAQCQMGCLFV